MPHSSEHEHLFLARLTLPVSKLMVRSAVACAEQVAALLGLDRKAGFGVKVAVDEAFCNAVEHFSGPVDQEERMS